VPACPGPESPWYAGAGKSRVLCRARCAAIQHHRSRRRRSRQHLPPKGKNIRDKTHFIAPLLAAALLAACGGDDGPRLPPISIDGLAATGAAVAGKVVTIKCAVGDPATATTDSRGAFRFDLTTQGMPCMLEVDAGGTMGKLHGFTTTAGRVNVTPLSSLVVARALGANPATAFANISAAALNSANNNIAAATTAVAGDANRLMGWTFSVNPMTGVFAIGDEDDRALDALGATLASASATLTTLTNAAAAGTSLAAVLPAEEARGQNAKTFTVNAADFSATTFAALPVAAGDGVDVTATQRVAGRLAAYDNNPLSPFAAYRVEVPTNWNGELVMYAHGYAGEGAALAGNNAAIRRHLVRNGYAWAASGFSKNSYDVRAGVEDTNKLALAFATITGRAAPSRIYIMGHSMGGHITAAAMEEETLATAVNRVRYAGAVPMCGVMGDAELFNGFAAQGMAALNLSGLAAVLPASLTARQRYQSLLGTEFNPNSLRLPSHTALFNNFPTTGFTPKGTAGAQYTSVVRNTTGGTRPLFDIGLSFGGSYVSGAYGNFGVDATLTGILNRYNVDTRGITYVVDGDAATSAALNAGVPKIAPDADYNRLRRDGMRWVPVASGKPYAPMVSIHTLGDLFVPFSMQQIYRNRVVANGAARADRVVQRAIRGATHCDFTNAEMQTAFDDMVRWVKQGTKPAGDDVLTPAVVAATTYGCTHTNNTLHPLDEATGTTRTLRGLIQQLGQSCPAS
jgi:pimeloyl-ACP methyl ester carboxylesterase